MSTCEASCVSSRCRRNRDTRCRSPGKADISQKTSRRSSRRSAKRAIGPTQIAPMSLVTFEDARPWARSIKRARRERARCRPGTSTRTSASRNSRTIAR